MRSPAAGIFFTLVCLIGSLAVHDRAAVADDLTDFRSEPGRFRIVFPGSAPASRSLSGEKFAVTTNNFVHTVNVDETEFAVERHDIPRFAAMLLTEDFILDQAKEGMLANIGAREVASRKVSQQEHPARRVQYEVPGDDLEGELLLVLAERRLYLVTSHHPTRTEPPVTFGRFLDSFEFWLE